MSILQIKNCTFKNNSVDGVGGVILSLNNSIDISYSIFEGNKAGLGGAIHQETSKMKLNQCLFFGNSDTAVSSSDNSKISIMNSILKNNTAEHQGGAVAMTARSVLNVSNTTFGNNIQISAQGSINLILFS